MGLNVNIDFYILFPYTHLEEYIQVIFAEMSIRLVRHVEDTDEVVPMRVCINTADVCKNLALTAREDAINNASNWGFYMTDFATKSVEDDGMMACIRIYPCAY